MEERETSPLPPLPPPPCKRNPNDKLQLQEINGTYVVQVPKDQVYHVPPAENSHIIQLHKKSRPKEGKTSRCCLCCVLLFIIFFVLVILLGGVLGGLFSMLVKPKDPRLSFQRFKVTETKPHPKYDITMLVHNPNSAVGISYKNKGRVSLSLRGQEIASGAYQPFHQDPHEATAVSVSLNGSKASLPKEVEESVKNVKKKVNVTFSLAIHALARMKMGLLHSGTMKFDIRCKLKLDSLAKTTQILSQQCQTKRH
ncbi:hypothetical protein VNO78_01386 [Psophocarpus tetragonolobus]|uniref:Late embryogenesis abundant protein LEA-2 subgroup domain-containing protein n=1 Tax=Psophocarpus tetragonolobus TaxID=3891 RepID=A0AAN9XUN4_PSOTE